MGRNHRKKKHNHRSQKSGSVVNKWSSLESLETGKSVHLFSDEKAYQSTLPDFFVEFDSEGEIIIVMDAPVLNLDGTDESMDGKEKDGVSSEGASSSSSASSSAGVGPAMLSSSEDFSVQGTTQLSSSVTDSSIDESPLSLTSSVDTSQVTPISPFVEKRFLNLGEEQFRQKAQEQSSNSFEDVEKLESVISNASEQVKMFLTMIQDEEDTYAENPERVFEVAQLIEGVEDRNQFIEIALEYFTPEKIAERKELYHTLSAQFDEVEGPSEVHKWRLQPTMQQLNGFRYRDMDALATLGETMYDSMKRFKDVIDQSKSSVSNSTTEGIQTLQNLWDEINSLESVETNGQELNSQLLDDIISTREEFVDEVSRIIQVWNSDKLEIGSQRALLREYQRQMQSMLQSIDFEVEIDSGFDKPIRNMKSFKKRIDIVLSELDLLFVDWNLLNKNKRKKIVAFVDDVQYNTLVPEMQNLKIRSKQVNFLMKLLLVARPLVFLIKRWTSTLDAAKREKEFEMENLQRLVELWRSRRTSIMERDNPLMTMFLNLELNRSTYSRDLMKLKESLLRLQFDMGMKRLHEDLSEEEEADFENLETRCQDKIASMTASLEQTMASLEQFHKEFPKFEIMDMGVHEVFGEDTGLHDKRVSLDQYTIAEEIGASSARIGDTLIQHSTYKAEFDGLTVALKKFQVVDKKSLDLVDSEILHRYQLQHANILPINRFFREGSAVYVESRFAENGNMYQWLQTNPDEWAIKSVLRQLVSGLSFAHTQGYVHRNLQESNVLIASNLHTFITDFEFSTKTVHLNESRDRIAKLLGVRGKPSSSSSKGKEKVEEEYRDTGEMLAPELEAGEAHTEKSDIWNLGVIVFHAFYNMSNPSMAANGKGMAIPNSEQVNDDLKLLISSMLAFNPNDRPTADEILVHPYFTQPSAHQSKENQQFTLSKIIRNRLVDDAIARVPQGGSYNIEDVPRSTLVTTFANSFSSQSIDQVCGSFHVTFQDEPGIDQGGVTADLITQFFTKCFEEQFESGSEAPSSGKTYLPKKDMPVNVSVAFGKLMLRCMVKKFPMPSGVCPALFKFLMNQPVTLGDLEMFDVRSATSYRMMLATRGVDMMDLTFEGLKPGGELLLVDDTNKLEYVQLSVQKMLIGDRETAMLGIREGFQMVQDLNPYLELMEVEDLMMKLVGHSTITAQLVLDNINWSGDWSDGEKNNLIRFLMEADEDMLRKFVFLAAATFSIPANGMDPKLTVTRLSDSSNLVVGHNCFNTIDLPAYSSYNKLYTKLKLSLDNCVESGFGFG